MPLGDVTVTRYFPVGIAFLTSAVMAIVTLLNRGSGDKLPYIVNVAVNRYRLAVTDARRTAELGKNSWFRKELT
jgi:hypothetical protein